jgi:hypothetical protein
MGLSKESPFFKETIDKIGVERKYIHFKIITGSIIFNGKRI